jgi:hypothetical protein
MYYKESEYIYSPLPENNNFTTHNIADSSKVVNSRIRGLTSLFRRFKGNHLHYSMIHPPICIWNWRHWNEKFTFNSFQLIIAENSIYKPIRDFKRTNLHNDISPNFPLYLSHLGLAGRGRAVGSTRTRIGPIFSQNRVGQGRPDSPTLLETQSIICLYVYAYPGGVSTVAKITRQSGHVFLSSNQV